MSEAFQQVQLLVSETDVEVYRSTRKDLDKLRSIVEKSELWVYRNEENTSAALAAQQNFAMIKRYGPVAFTTKLCELHLFVCRVLVNISELCLVEFRESRVHHQRLLRNLNAHSEIMQLLKMPCDPADEAIQSIQKTAHKFLQAFCKGNRENQLEMSRYVPYFVDQVN
jgi:hypothetical protein